jgi:hypothetical protein
LIASFGEALIRNIDAYIDRVWNIEKPAMLEKAAYINRYFDGTDRIREWERIAGRAFEFDVFEIVLCSAIKNGTDANSLGYDRVIFYNGSDRDTMTEFISHEIGTHIFIGMLKDVFGTGEFEFPILYEGYELLSRYYNTIILNKSPLSYPMSTFHVPEYLEIYQRLHEAKPSISPENLLIEGIRSFQRLSAS